MSTSTANQPVKITKTVVDRLKPPTQGQAFLRDSQTKGFGVRITATGVRSFIVEKRVHGRVRRMTLGRYGELTVEQARKQAQRLLGQVAIGIDPIAEKRRSENENITLSKAYQDFKAARKSLKPKTLRDYDRLLEVVFGDWAKKRVIDISKTMVAKRHREVGENRGEAYANLAMRFLKSLLHFAQANYDDGTGHSILPENPVIILNQTRAWYRQEKRQTSIKVHQLPAWYQAVFALKNEDTLESGHTVADFLLLVLLTGLRKQEALTLKWENVDLKDRSLMIPDPKNREPLRIPLSDFLKCLLFERYENAVNDYVFPGREGKGYLVEPKRPIKKVIELSGVLFTVHDLRRTFITIAESLDIAPYAIKRLVNHKMSGDVTAGYIVSDIERLRAPMQKITDFILRAARHPDEFGVVPFIQANVGQDSH